MAPKVSEEHMEERRKQILDAAVRGFSRRGLHQTTIEDIRLEAELSRGAVYHYFKTKEDIILATVSAFGHGGPWRHRVGFDGVAQAMSGAMYMSGTPTEPSRLYYPWVDFTTAILTAFGTMSALLERAKSGQGQQVEGALLMSALTVGNGTLIEQGVIEANRVATGNRSQTAAPSDCFATKDGWVLVMSIGQPLFERWCELMGESHWLEDPRFADDISRGNNGEVISERQLHRHRTRAGFRIGDSRHIDLFRYVAWLVSVRHDPKPDRAVKDYEAVGTGRNYERRLPSR